MGSDGNDFYAKIPIFRDFHRLMDPALYAPLPDDWTIGVADIVDSTKAIADRRYKTVNMAGAAVVAAITNVLDGREFPFVFGGDGASFAVAPADLDRVRDALAATATWVKDDLDLTMRVALVPLADIRAQGRDVRVARFGPSKNVSYAMFSGGGLGWAESAMKRGDYAVTQAPAGSYPDLTGLSCRFEEMPSARGLILAVLVMPRDGGDVAAFRGVIEDIIALVERSPDAARPIPAQGPSMTWPPAGLELEVRAGRGARSRARFRPWVMMRTLFVYTLVRFGISFGGFAPQAYMRELVENSDFRKYDDGLRMILDCASELERELAERLATAASAGIVRYGLHRQDAAMMTCFTPSALRSDHVHFIDGARGGYASAATALKSMPT
ncbi:MAG: adenylate cyclase [Bradyrhizobiaceae bacterium PARB1]|nr:MAG: adenylate cyclase [Bradyrhizobiaceae bacterium PARB1]